MKKLEMKKIIKARAGLSNYSAISNIKWKLSRGIGATKCRMVKDRVPDRADVLVPGAPVRDSEGRIIGANGLSM